MSTVTRENKSLARALPNKLSELIRVSLDDEAAAFKSAQYSIEMDDWHCPGKDYRKDPPYRRDSSSEVCEVCLAGAVMAFSLKCDPQLDIHPDAFSNKTEQKLYALDAVRDGCVSDADAFMKGRRRMEAPVSFSDDEWNNFPIVDYDDDRIRWRRDMRKIAHRLEKVNL